MSVITVSSSFGSGGSVVAQRVATKLGWPLLNRAITAEVASHLSIPLELAEAHDENAETGWRRLLQNLPMSVNSFHESSITVDPSSDEVMLRTATEKVLRDAAESNTVVVGRAGAIVLKDRDDALHVRLDGPVEARTRQGAEALGLTLAEAAKKLQETDRARAAYIKELYGLDWRDPRLYHLLIDSSAFSLDGCADMILRAAHARLGTPITD